MSRRSVWTIISKYRWYSLLICEQSLKKLKWMKVKLMYVGQSWQKKLVMINENCDGWWCHWLCWQNLRNSRHRPLPLHFEVLRFDCPPRRTVFQKKISVSSKRSYFTVFGRNFPNIVGRHSLTVVWRSTSPGLECSDTLRQPGRERVTRQNSRSQINTDRAAMKKILKIGKQCASLMR